MQNRLSELRRHKGLSQQALALLVGTGKSQIVKLERGERRLDLHWIERLSRALEVPPQALIGEVVPARVELAGYVGAGTRIYPLDTGGFGGVICPPGLHAEETGAALVRGDSMPPMGDGWGLFWRLGPGGGIPAELPEDCLGRLCVVQVAEDGPLYVKKLRPGYQPGRFNLISTNGEPMEDVKLDWMARVRLAMPPDELEFVE
jgi:DNA-binding XRE family transcriptional regulator